MENLFERLPFGGVLENYAPKRLAIQVAVERKNAEPELLEQLPFNLLKIDKFSGDGIGVEKLGVGKNFLKTLAKSAFACRNAARDSDCRHAALIASVRASPTIENEKAAIRNEPPAGETSRNPDGGLVSIALGSSSSPHQIRAGMRPVPPTQLNS